MTLSPEILQVFSITNFIASICICILLVIEANVLIRLLPLIKQSADNSKKITDKIDQGEEIIKTRFNPLRIEGKQGVIRKFDGMLNCIHQGEKDHIHSKECFS